MEVDYTERIKGIFDACDTEGSGYITIDHLKDLAKDQLWAAGEEETIGIIQLLDPEGKGKVSFTDFCQGVQQILEVQALSQQSTPMNSGNHTNLIKSLGLSPVSLPEVCVKETLDNSEASVLTFNEYSTNTDEDGGQLVDYTAPETPGHLHPSYGHSSSRSSVTSRTDDDYYEDFGVVNLESDSSDANLSCDSCHSRSRRSPRHKHKSPSRQLASAIYASHQARGVRSPNKDIYNDIDGSFQEITERIKSLEKQLNKVVDEKSKEDGAKSRYKGDNDPIIKSVVDKIQSMEEHLKEMDLISAEKLNGEKMKIQEMLMKQSVESEKMDYITLRLQTFETENEKLKSDVVQLNKENEKLRMDKLQISDRLSAMEEDYNRVSAEYNEMMGKFDREQIITGELLDELQKELEDLRKYKIECEHNHRHMCRTPSISDSFGINPFQAEMQKLKETNKHLLEENEELNGQLLVQAVNVGRHMLQEGSSVAEELEQMTKEELMTSLQERKDVNFRLKQYVDKILTIVLEKNPSILEIGCR